MQQFRERIPREVFKEAFRPMVRSLGSKTVILRLNETARTAIPRQTKLKDLMPKLELLCYEQSRPKVEEELERLWSLYFENRLGEASEKFYDLSDQLNQDLDGDKLPEDEEKLQNIKKTISILIAFLEESDFSPEEVELTFRVKAYPEVLAVFLEIIQPG